MKNILLLEDDRVLSASLKEFLELSGYSVDVVYQGSSVYDLAYEKKFDLYILDINVPDIDGFEVLQALRESGDVTPAIYISALTDINSIIKGFKIGVDDYIKKPFNPEELLIRIKSRYQDEETIEVYDLCYHTYTKVLYKKGNIIHLGEVQKNILHLLLTRLNEIVSIHELMELLENPTHNALRVNLAKLKSKLGIEIKNIRAQGYMIEEV